MTTTTGNEIRAKYVTLLMSVLSEEDTGLIASNSFNFPIVAPDGEEAWVEIVVKIPKEDDGYDKREEYRIKSEERAAKAKEAAEKKAKKIAEAKAKKEAKEAKEKA